MALVAILGRSRRRAYLEREDLESAEFYALVLFATAGMGVLASAQELLTAFIGLEMSSISSYVLAGYRRDTLKSSESAMKYFLLGSFATAFFLYGIALVYGVTGTTILTLMAAADAASNLLKLGLALILIGLGFKVATAPFQIWTPDVYEGAPTPVTALFSAGPKAAAFALLLRIFATVPAATHFWFWAFWILGRPHHVRRQPRRAGADQRQALARLQLHRPRRLHPGGFRRGHLSCRRTPTLAPPPPTPQCSSIC